MTGAEKRLVTGDLLLEGRMASLPSAHLAAITESARHAKLRTRFGRRWQDLWKRRLKYIHSVKTVTTDGWDTS